MNDREPKSALGKEEQVRTQADSPASVLDTVVNELPLTLTALQRDALLSYVDLLLRWNGTYNLTAIREAKDVMTQHVADCLALVAPLRRELAGASNARVLDVGSGGGLPGVVIAVLCPELAVACIDSVGKKAAFARQVAAELRLPNLAAIHARVEQHRSAPFDVIACRAFGALASFVELTRSHLANGGRWVAMKGRLPTDEIAALPSDIEVAHVDTLTVPLLQAERCLVWMRRRA